MLRPQNTETIDSQAVPLSAQLDSLRVQEALLVLRIHAHRVTASELLEEGTRAGKEIAARLTRGAALLSVDLNLVREERQRLERARSQ